MAGGVVLGTGGWLAACGGDDRGGAVTGGSPATRSRSGGALRVGVAGGGPKDSIDAHLQTTDPDIARAFQLYEPLAIRNADYELEMVLAESIEADTPDTWTVRLREGVTFHDGRPVTADDVLFSLRRIIDPRHPKTGTAALAAVDGMTSRKLDDRTVRIRLTAPNVGFPDDLGQYFNSIVPTDYDPRQPVGTGPFKFESFTPGQRSVFVKNPAYWRPDEPVLDRLEIIDFPDDTARVNALLGGQVEAITNLPPAQIGAVEGNSALKVLISDTGNWQPFTMRVDAPPFADVRVRQALRLIVDRDEMVRRALSGQGRPGNDLYAPYDPAYARELPQREQDLEQATSLLRQAGQSDLRVELVTAPVYQGLVEAAEVFADMAKAAGVTVKVRKTDAGTFYGDNYLKWRFAQDFWFTRTYLAQVSQGSLKSSPFNETHWDHPLFVRLIEQARAELDDGKRADLLHQAQAIEHERGGYLVWSFSNQIDAHSSQVRGFAPARSGIPLTNYGFRSVGFAA
jgi:peptide/nickel transport system substrate-binding protein